MHTLSRLINDSRKFAKLCRFVFATVSSRSYPLELRACNPLRTNSSRLTRENESVTRDDFSDARETRCYLFLSFFLDTIREFVEFYVLFFFLLKLFLVKRYKNRNERRSFFRTSFRTIRFARGVVLVAKSKWKKEQTHRLC